MQSKWPVDSWVSVKYDCKVLGHVWRWSLDRTKSPPAVATDVICVECLKEIDAASIMLYLMDFTFMTRLGGSYTNEDLWNAIADDEDVS